MTLTRRNFVAGGSLALGLGSLTTAALKKEPPISTKGLKDIAARRGLSFGCAVRDQHLSDKLLSGTITHECDIVVAEVAMKWAINEPLKDDFQYNAADNIVRFARINRLALRGHTAFWYRSVPQWATGLLRDRYREKVITDRVTEVVRRYKGEVSEWDVVNEAIEPRDGQFRGLRTAPFGASTGIQYIADSFHAAHEADYDAKLFYNDYGLEYDTPQEDARRAAVLALLTDLKRQNVPIHGLGLQTHAGVGRRFDAVKYRLFLKNVADLGLIMRLTEFDVADRNAPPGFVERDKAVAAHASELLHVALDERAVKGILCWGLRDQDSWLAQNGKRKDGLAPRPLPFTDDLRPKPLRSSIAEAFANAPDR